MSAEATPRVSVVVVNFETPKLLPDCLASVSKAALALTKSRDEGCEVIVVDNGSSDGSVAILQALRPAPHVIVLPANRGFAAGANAGIEAARGEFVLLLNSDARLGEETLLPLLDAFEADPTLGIAGPQLVYPDGRLQNAGHAFPSVLGELLPTGLLELALPRRFPSKRYPHATPYAVDAVQGAALMLRSSLIERIGSFAEAYFFFLEETDLCKRARDAGYVIRVVPAARVVHGAGASSKQRDPIRTRIEFHRSLYVYYRNHQGVEIARTVAAIRFARALLGLLAALPIAALVPRVRQRIAGRRALVRWYVQGRPDDAGLEGRYGARESSRAGPPTPSCAQHRT